VSQTALSTLSIKLSNAAPLLGSVTRNVVAQVHRNWVFHLVGRIDTGSDVKALGNTAATEWFGLSTLAHRGDFAYDGWAIDVLEALARPREEAIRIRSVDE
jgi:hypothetical protein